MIFYFSGTGNSRLAAEWLAAEGEVIVNLAQAVQEKKFQYEIEEDQKLGFVFPVYFGGIPSIVQNFMNHVSFKGKPMYTYAVITCGANIYGAGKMLADRLAEQEITLDAVYQIVMPDNYVVMYSIQSEEEEEAILRAAEHRLTGIADEIKACKKTDLMKNKMAGVMTSLMYPLYARGRKTKKFWTDDRCVSCGACEKKCPSKAIKLIDGQVTWVKDQCAHCMACMSCNAIQYGKQTMKRRRYKYKGAQTL